MVISRLQTLAILLAVLFGIAAGQISKSVAHDSHVDSSTNKFLQREAHRDQTEEQPGADEYSDNMCPQNLAVRWHTEVSSSVVATPLITDFFSDGRKDIVVPGFSHAVEIVEGPTGAKDPTFQARHHSTLHTSPLTYDVDFDGVLDIVAATYDGEVLFFKDNGEEASYRMTIPRLRIRREWYVGLSADPIDHNKPDVGAGDDSGEFEFDTPARRLRRLMQVDTQPRRNNQQQQQGRAVQTNKARGGSGRDGALFDVAEKERLTEEAAESFNELFGDEEGDYEEDFSAAGQGSGDDDMRHILPGHDVRHVKKGHQGQQERPHAGALGKNTKQGVAVDEEGEDPGDDDFMHDYALHEEDEEEAAETRDYSDYADYDYLSKVDQIGNGDENENEIDGGGNQGIPDQLHDMDYGMWDYHIRDESKDTYVETKTPYLSPYAYVDAHILATPTIADIDGDGREELIVAVSYFFDSREYESGSPRSMWLGEGIDISKYVASGVVVFDLHTRATKWTQHLDLSTADTRYVAYAYCPPTVADVNGDGKLEVIVGASMGFLYVLNADTGDTLEGWPIQMGDIQAQVAVADIDGDGALEIVAADLRGSVAAFRANAKEVWERHLGSAIESAPMLGDVDGDGQLEVVVGSYDGRIHVLDGRNGKDVKPFPYRTYGHISAPILLTKLDNEKRAGLQLIVVAGDGVLYVIDGVTGCADTLDVGEPSRAMVLVEDLSSTGRLDLLITTLGGTLYSIRTAAKYQPLKAWASQAPGGATPLVARWNWEGVYTVADSRVPRDVRGEFVPVRFKVVDNRPRVAGKARGPYKVSATLLGVGVKEMNMGDRPIIGMSDTVNSTGTYVLEVPCPRTRTTATIRVEMQDEQGMVFWDEFTLSFHIHFYRLLKWMALAPFLFTAAAILTFRPARDAMLPS